MRLGVAIRLGSSSAIMLTGTPAASPSNLAGSAASDSQIDGTYTPSATSGATHQIEFSSNGGDSYTTQTVTGGAYSLTGLDPITNYLIRLRASTIWGDSDYAGPIGVSTPDNPPSIYPALDFHDARNSMYAGQVV